MKYGDRGRVVTKNGKGMEQQAEDKGCGEDKQEEENDKEKKGLGFRV